MFFFTTRKCIWAIFPRCFFHHQKNAFGRFWFSLVFFSLPREKEHLVEFFGSVQLVWLPHLNCVIICFFKALQKASDPSGIEMKKIICARAVRITTSELWVAHIGWRVSHCHPHGLASNPCQSVDQKGLWLEVTWPFSTYGSFGCFFLPGEKASTPSALDETHFGPLRCGSALGTQPALCVARCGGSKIVGQPAYQLVIRISEPSTLLVVASKVTRNHLDPRKGLDWPVLFLREHHALLLRFYLLRKPHLRLPGRQLSLRSVWCRWPGEPQLWCLR